jgi:hypothetical protein
VITHDTHVPISAHNTTHTMRAVAAGCEQGQVALISAHGSLAVNQNKILLKRIMAATENEQVRTRANLRVFQLVFV